MAGTLFGLPLSQRVDANGDPAVGWLLYLYQANTSTPVNSYQDTGLTVLNTWPLEADASGMMGVFWLADGSYRARATSNDGSVVYYDLPNIVAIGPSTGAPPPSGVDPTAIFQTGDLIWVDVEGARSGWVRDNGNTIGSATSGGTERANADCQSLFEFLWNGFSNTLCPVTPGRGSNALADWTANKKIQLPDKRGYMPIGADVMGNVSSGRFAGVAGIVSSTVPGSSVGENAHILTLAEAPTGISTLNFSDPGHTHSLPATGSKAAPNSAGFNAIEAGTAGNTGNNTTGINASITDHAGGGAHSNVPLAIIGTFYRKL